MMEVQAHRLASGGLVDRERPIPFTFDGKVYHGFAGDTLASALTANGVRLLGRSFKYHRPRGLLTCGPEEPNALIELGVGAQREPNTRATVTELHAGLHANSQNRWPSLRFDLASAAGLFDRFIGAGFYYKTFMWPAAFWEKVYEPAIRRAAGLGRASGAADPDSYEKVHAFCDVLIVGAGPAGLAAALAAGRSCARVILCDEDFRVGGRLLADGFEVDGSPGVEWAGVAEVELLSQANVRVMRRTTVTGVYDGRAYLALERVSDHPPSSITDRPRQRLWKIVARQCILAAGALELPLIFSGNDRPGVMMSTAVRSYLRRFAVSPGRRAAVFTTTDDGWRTGFDLARAGIDVEAIADARTDVSADLISVAESLGFPVYLGARVTNTGGGVSLNSATLRLASGEQRKLRVDLLAVSGGWTPQIGLTSHLGSRPAWSDALSAFAPGKLPEGMSVAGAAAGALSLGLCLASGAAAGHAVARREGFVSGSPPTYQAMDEASGFTALWPERGLTNAFVDPQNDVTTKDLEIAVLEGFRSVEHVKRYTTLGMATDQGRTFGVNGHAFTALLTDRTIAQAGSTISRPPHVPVAIAAFAGQNRGQDFKPTRLTPGHAWAVEHGAVFTCSGQWKRASYFPGTANEAWGQAMAREVKAVRNQVGVCDVSTLGKIDIQGPDAARLLDRLYTNLFSSLPVGRARYGLMLREDGIVFDDGATARLGDDRYVMSTTTGNAASVMQHLDYHLQVVWPELDVQAVSVTEQWAQFAVAGPRSRELLQAFLGDALDLANAAFPYMAVAETMIGGVTARVFRLSFSGELGYEIAVPAQFGDSLVRALMRLGEPLGVRPYGLEALGVMRIEKGHVAGGELTGQTTAGDLGLAGLLSPRKDFVGKALAARAGLADPDRPTLVGLKAVVAARPFRAGAQVLEAGAATEGKNSLGHVTSSVFSPTIGGWIGLGLIRHGPERLGERLRAYDPVRSADTLVEVCSPVFVDPEGTRIRG